MKIPEGMSFTVGFKSYKAGDELPAFAPENIKKQVQARINELEKAKAVEKQQPENPAQTNPQPSQGDKDK